MTDQEIPALKLFVAIADRQDAPRVETILRERRVLFHYLLYGKGTASSEVLKALGLSGADKAVFLCIETGFRASGLLAAAVERLELARPGRGVAFVLPLTGISAGVSSSIRQEREQQIKRWVERMETEAKASGETRYELVAAVVSQGYSENVMDAAHQAGARGGTIVHARRGGTADAAKFFGITLQEEKEIVMILIPHERKAELMGAICKACGAKTEAKGIVFSLPVEDCAGIGQGESH